MASHDPQKGDPETDADEVVPVVDDYSQRPQRPIRLKPGISQEPPSEMTRRGPPSEILSETSGAPKTTPKKPRAISNQWTLRGVSPEVREAITKAAKDDGMTSGAWVDQALREAWAEDPNPAPGEGIDLTPVLAELKEIRQRLEALESRRGLFACLVTWLGRK